MAEVRAKWSEQGRGACVHWGLPLESSESPTEQKALGCDSF